MATAKCIQRLSKRLGSSGLPREIIMGSLIFAPVAFLAWLPLVWELQTRTLFNLSFSRGLQISRILGGPKEDRSSNKKE